MTAISAHHAPRRHLALAWGVGASLLLLAMAVPALSVAQIGSQTGYQEWVPPEGGGGTVGGSSDPTGGGSGDPTGGGSGSASGGASGNGTLNATGGGGASRGGTVGEGGGPAAGPGAQPAQPGSNDKRASAEATGVLVTSDNILLALVVAVAAIGAGLAVNKLARHAPGT
jgi:hypothetical protein